MRGIGISLEDKTALVTGGNGGIGLGIALGLAKAGAAVAIHGRDERKNRSALAKLRALNPACRAFTHDLADRDGIPDFFRRVCEEMSGLDVLVNNAGITKRAPAIEMTDEDFENVLGVNLVAPFLLAREFARERIACGKGGRVLFLASLMSEAARPGVSNYTASKGGVRQLVKALAVEWARHGILVNALGPGYVDTEMTAPLKENRELNDWVLRRTPLGRWGRPEDFQTLAAYLASDANTFVTGQIVYVDGGFLAAL